MRFCTFCSITNSIQFSTRITNCSSWTLFSLQFSFIEFVCGEPSIVVGRWRISICTCVFTIVTDISMHRTRIHKKSTAFSPVLFDATAKRRKTMGQLILTCMRRLVVFLTELFCFCVSKWFQFVQLIFTWIISSSFYSVLFFVGA